MDIMLMHFNNVYKIENHNAIRKLFNMGWVSPEYLISIPPLESQYIRAGFTIAEREALGYINSDSEKKKQD